ncbi:MAG TPA: hypothetical protein VN903_14830 [Polyangia bacterium]|jgi:hypothetical protein|nr:hypothetical protein [Polyangia bacterium]
MLETRCCPGRRTNRPFRRALAVLTILAAACVPDVGSNPVPTAMQFDLTTMPPRAPQPTALIVNPQTKRIDFSLAGTPIPDDCASQQVLTQAQCQFDQYLQTLDGFPNVTTAAAPATAALDPATLTLGLNQNVVAVGVQKASGLVMDGAVGFDAASTSLTLLPAQGWVLGEFYWVGVRGYAGGVRDANGGEVVGSPTMSLLKQDDPLTCGATDPSAVDPHCPAFQVVAAQAPSTEVAAERLFQLEAIRQAYIDGHAFDAMLAAGLPKAEIAVLWGFPIHTNSVAVLSPTAGVVPRVPAADQIGVGVLGPVDPATVSAFSAAAPTQGGSVVVIDLAAVLAGDLAAAFPPVAAAYTSSAIVIQASAPFPAGHPIGLFFKNTIHAPDGAPLVASPVSVLLTLTATLVGSDGHSTVSGVSDADAAALESGRVALAPLLDNPNIAALTGITRANLVYCYAFVPMVQP